MKELPAIYNDFENVRTLRRRVYAILKDQLPEGCQASPGTRAYGLHILFNYHAKTDTWDAIHCEPAYEQDVRFDMRIFDEQGDSRVQCSIEFPWSGDIEKDAALWAKMVLARVDLFMQMLAPPPGKP